MLPTFLLLLVSAIGSILISFRASHEIPKLLAGASAIFCSIYAFAMAPWPIQVLLLLLILQMERLYSIRRAGEVPIAISYLKRK